jgi:Fic family protein
MQTSLNKINDLVSTLKSLPQISEENQRKLEKKFRLEFNYNSNHIEGNTLTYGETELLLIFDKTDGTHEMREYEEMKAHDVAYKIIHDWAKDTEHPLTETYIKQLNEIILVRPFWKEAITSDGQATRRLIKVGEYKEFPNSVRLQNGELFEYASPIDTPIKMGELMQWYNTEIQKNELHPVALAAMLHYKFVCIHPFDDGNGRISRLLMNYVLIKNNLPPIIIKTNDKKNYLNALNQADTGNLEAFVKYIADQLAWSIQLVTKATKGESVEEPEDLDKRLALLELELDAVDPNEEVKYRFSKEVFIQIYKSWLSELIKELVPAIQKFNKFFTGTTHHINLGNGVSSTQFINEEPDEILAKLERQFSEKNNNFNEYESRTQISAQYGTLIKGGLKTFGCNYGVEIKFDFIKYEVFVDEFTEGNQRKQVKFFERLLHKPLTKTDITKITKQLTDAIYEHIDVNTKKNGLR